MNFYVDDEQNTTTDFEHLNVTIERVTLVHASGDAESETEADTDDAEAGDETGAETESEANTMNNTDAEASTSAEMEIEANMMASTTSMSTLIDEPVDVDADADAGVGADVNIESADVSNADAAKDESKVAYEVDNVAVDLTELQGESASLVGEYDVLEGNCTKVFVYVGEMNETLKAGERIDVKLSNNRSQFDTDLEAGNDESIDFIFDIMVFEAGNNGEYIPKPVVSESGTDAPITRAGAEETTGAEAAAEAEADANTEVEAAENKTDDNGERTESDAGGDLSVSFGGDVSTGGNATVIATWNGASAESAMVTINDETVGTVGIDGELGAAIPGERGVTIAAADGESEAEAGFEFEIVGSAPDNPDEGDESTTLAA